MKVDQDKLRSRLWAAMSQVLNDMFENIKPGTSTLRFDERLKCCPSCRSIRFKRWEKDRVHFKCALCDYNQVYGIHVLDLDTIDISE